MKNWFRKHSNGVEIAIHAALFIMICAMCVFMGIMISAVSYKFTPHPSIRAVYWILCVLWWLVYVGFIEVKKYNQKHNRRKIYTHEIAANIVDEFEELLDAHDITLTDKWREGGEEEARMYGETYCILLENVESIVIDAIHTVTDEEEVEIISDIF